MGMGVVMVVNCCGDALLQGGGGGQGKRGWGWEVGREEVGTGVVVVVVVCCSGHGCRGGRVVVVVVVIVVTVEVMVVVVEVMAIAAMWDICYPLSSCYERVTSVIQTSTAKPHNPTQNNKTARRTSADCSLVRKGEGGEWSDQRWPSIG